MRRMVSTITTIAAVSALAFSLAACATNKVGPYYDNASFSAKGQTRLSFDEAKSVCRTKNLEHHWMGDTLDLNIPNYTACMEAYGYDFHGTGGAGSASK